MLTIPTVFSRFLGLHLLMFSTFILWSAKSGTKKRTMNLLQMQKKKVFGADSHKPPSASFSQRAAARSICITLAASQLDQDLCHCSSLLCLLWPWQFMPNSSHIHLVCTSSPSTLNPAGGTCFRRVKNGLSPAPRLKEATADAGFTVKSLMWVHTGAMWGIHTPPAAILKAPSRWACSY